MITDSLTIIHWRGNDSILEAVQLIEDHQNIELSLPANYHHACYSHLYPEADPALSETIDIGNGSEIISKISEVEGLEGLISLVEPVQKTKARVLMKSPIPRLYIGFKFNTKWFS